MDRQVDLLELLVNGASARTHVVHACTRPARAHTPAAFAQSDESGEVGNAAQ